MLLFKKKPIIRFHTTTEKLNSIPHPVPAARAMPLWFKNLKPKPDGHEQWEAGTVKRCMPVLDAVSQGYIIPLWADLHVEVAVSYNFYDSQDKLVLSDVVPNPETLIGTVDKETQEVISSYNADDNLAIQMRFSNANDNEETIGTHSWDQVGQACTLKKFKLGKVLLKLINPWVIETSAGYSIKFQNPANNWDYDIQLIEGVVDTDSYYANVNLPFVWTGSEVGTFLIPRGTPIAHIIPFKRERMDMELGVVDRDKVAEVNTRLSTKFFNRYKQFYWNKK